MRKFEGRVFFVFSFCIQWKQKLAVKNIVSLNIPNLKKNGFIKYSGHEHGRRKAGLAEVFYLNELKIFQSAVLLVIMHTPLDNVFLH